jgi:hypothetical protein
MIAWFIAPYKRRNPGETPAQRYCSIDDYTELINTDGGIWVETEVLGDTALVKVRASAATLTTINAEPGVLRIPAHTNLNDTLGDLTAGQRQALKDKALEMGYTLGEINAALPADWSAVTLRQVLRFLATRRLKPRYDQGTDTIVLDGAVQPVKDVEAVDGLVN